MTVDNFSIRTPIRPELHYFRMTPKARACYAAFDQAHPALFVGCNPLMTNILVTAEYAPTDTEFESIFNQAWAIVDRIRQIPFKDDEERRRFHTIIGLMLDYRDHGLAWNCDDTNWDVDPTLGETAPEEPTP